MSGSKNCPETPRQRMIGMMYLVLTAMLALNVSSSILEGFSMVDNSLHTTIESTSSRNKFQYSDFESLYKLNPTKVKEWLDKALLVKKKSDELYQYIQEFKKNIVRLTDKKDANDSAYVRQIEAKDNLDFPTQYAIVEGHGKELKRKIEEYSRFLISFNTENASKNNIYRSIFSTASQRQKDGTYKPWETALFEDMPVAAVVTILTKYQSDIRASESELIQFLKAQTDATDFRVNKIQAMVIPESKYIIRGDKYRAQIVLSAIDSTKKPTYYVNGSVVGNGKYEINCSETGEKKYTGKIMIPGNDGIERVYSFASEYTVGEPTATVSNEDLNVLYKGFDNKLSVSVPGVAASSISIRAEGATVSQRSPGHYIVRPTRDGEARINVFAMINKSNLPMGGATYRVRLLPPPRAFLQLSDGKQIQDGYMSIDNLKSCQLVASYGSDELIKANFTVTSFTMIARGLPLQNISGTRLSNSFIDKLLKGDFLIISNIKAVGPDQVTRDLGSIGIRL